MTERSTVYLTLVSLSIATAGCRMPHFTGAVPDSLAKSRQISQAAVKALDCGQPQDAESKLASAVKICPTDPDARRYYAETLWLRNARKEAIVQLEAACNLTPDDVTTRVRLAEMYLDNGQTEQSRASVDQAIALDSKSSQVWAIRGRIMENLGDTRQALADYHRALGYRPGDQAVLLAVAQLYSNLAESPPKPADAEPPPNYWQRALETLLTLADTYSPGEESPQVLALLGRTYVALRRYDDGVEQFAAAAARSKPTADLLWRLADAQWRAHRPADATITLQQALTIDPGHPPSRALWSHMEMANQAIQRR